MQAEARRLIQGRNFGFLATVNPDGSPQVTPVWVDENDGYVLVDTAVGRLKERNTRRDPRVALAVLDWEDPYTYVEIRIGFKLFLMLSIIFFLLLSW
jgi:PPOX class probable F420-dependent enzyme